MVPLYPLTMRQVTVATIQLFSPLPYFKIIHGLIHINEQSNFLMLCPNIKKTRGHGYRLQKRMFHNDRYLYSFTNRAVDCWNARPNKIIYAKSFDAFSRGVKALDLAEFLKGVP